MRILNLVGVREEGVLTPNQAQKVEVQYVLDGRKFIASANCLVPRAHLCYQCYSASYKYGTGETLTKRSFCLALTYSLMATSKTMTNYVKRRNETTNNR